VVSPRDVPKRELAVSLCVDGHQVFAARHTMLMTVLIVILILALLGSLPTWGYSRNWGYGPGGGLGLILIIVIVLMLTGRV
jgi:hypothetical protein